MLHQFEISCKVCGARGFCDSENNGAIKIAFEKGTPSTMDRIIIYCSKCGGKQESGICWPFDTNAILTKKFSGQQPLGRMWNCPKCGTGYSEKSDVLDCCR